MKTTNQQPDANVISFQQYYVEKQLESFCLVLQENLEKLKKSGPGYSKLKLKNSHPGSDVMAKYIAHNLNKINYLTVIQSPEEAEFILMKWNCNEEIEA